MERYESLPSLLHLIDEIETRFSQFEPQVMAFVPEAHRFERLRREAQRLLDSDPGPDARPALWGVPVGVKDVIHVAGFTTQAGSRVPPAVLQGDEAECITRLRRAGALMMGKTNTTEFAYTAPPPTRNPHHPEHTPGGSSSGSAAAVAAGLCLLALGTQTIGSVIRPAAYCCVVGFKPSYDRIPRSGMIPLAPSLDHIGLVAPDAALARQAASVVCRNWRPVEPARRKPVLGIPEGPYLLQASQEMLYHFEVVCQALIADGYQVRRVPAMPDFNDIAERHHLILAGEAARVHAERFAAYGHLYRPETADMIRRGQRISSGALEQAREGRERLRAELMALMDAHRLDVWISPSAPGPAPKGLNYTGSGVMNLPWTHSGLPALNLPIGKNTSGLPLGLQVTARWYADEELLAWADVLEHRLQPCGVVEFV
jgi:Asp-tRNA(Asn)/Glu-tRNA(Gln) amidotransferase A subunit family amidase